MPANSRSEGESRRSTTRRQQLLTLGEDQAARECCGDEKGKCGDGKNHGDTGSVGLPVSKQANRADAVISVTVSMEETVQRAADRQQSENNQEHRQQTRQR